MNILVINHYAGNPQLGMEFRPYYLGREWVKTGNQVMIIGGSFSHLRKQQPTVPRENIEGIEYCWIPLKPYKGNGLGRIRSMFDFVRKLWFGYKKYLGNFRPDVVIASSTYPLDIYPARKIAQHYGGKLVYEVHDLWPLSPMELGGYSKYHPFIMVMQAAEDYCYRHADKVVSLLPNALEHMKERGMNPDKFVYIPNGFDPEEWSDAPNESEYDVALRELKERGKFLVGYTGGHAISNAIDDLLDAMVYLKGTNIIVVLVGDGIEKNRLMKKATEDGISDNVIFLPPVPKSHIPALLKHFDTTVIMGRRRPLYRFGTSPNKIFDYLMAAKPIVMSLVEPSPIPMKAGCALFYDHDSPKDFAAKLVEICALTEAERKGIGLNGKIYVEANHAYPILAKQFIDNIKK